MNDALTKESLVEIAQALQAVGKKLSEYIEANCNTLSDSDFNTLYFMQAHLISTVAYLVFESAEIQYTGCCNIRQNLKDALSQAQSILIHINHPRKMISLIAAVFDLSVDLSMGISTKNWHEVHHSAGRVSDLAQRLKGQLLPVAE